MDILENRDEWQATFQATWLDHYQKAGVIEWDLYNRPHNKSAPGTRGIDLSQSRLMLISTAGAYLRESQQPFDAADDLGDYSIRLFPTATSFDALAYAHDHYDQTAVKDDPQVLLPLRHLEGMVADGKIGALSSSVVSFMGYQPDVIRVVDEMIPSIVEAAIAEEVQAALLVPA